MTNDPEAVKAFRGMEALAETRLEFIEWLCEKHELDFAEEQEDFELEKEVVEKQRQEMVEYGRAFHKAFWGFHLDEHEHGTHCGGKTID